MRLHRLKQKKKLKYINTAGGYTKSYCLNKSNNLQTLYFKYFTIVNII